MIFHYICVSQDGTKLEGNIDSLNFDTAVADLQKRGLTVVRLDEKKGDVEVGSLHFAFKKKVEQKDIVIFSRQIATLFEAGVSALKAFRLLAVENDNPTLKEQLTIVSDDIERGTSLSNALEKQPNLFTSFYVNMVRSGEESGKLNQTFLYLADYLDREYELRQKTKKALTYPIFVIATFIVIMIVMFVFIIPKMSAMFAEQGAELPLVTRIVLGISDFFLNYGLYLLPLLVAGGWFLYRYSKTPEGGYKIDTWKLKIPVIKNLYQKIFLARLADNMNTMLTSGVPIVRSIEITAEVVDNLYYRELLLRVSNKVQNGTAFSKALYEEESIPNILIQMVRIGEETGELGYILKNLATFYKREVDTAIDNVIGLIEPAMIVGLGLGVGVLVASVLLPMYSLSSAIA
jgi:type IV pilus assembly protein PilC